ncbi:hypothetical protein GGF44_003925 [Coemansia sp. RSA 1694]|nr:hypothetical protein GGF44_003925 [Coemansia sp. RSA 1694]
MSDENIFIAARVNSLDLLTFYIPTPENVEQMSYSELDRYLVKWMVFRGAHFRNGFVMFNTKTNEPFTESPFANGDHAQHLEMVGEHYCLNLKATHLVN